MLAAAECTGPPRCPRPWRAPTTTKGWAASSTGCGTGTAYPGRGRGVGRPEGPPEPCPLFLSAAPARGSPGPGSSPATPPAPPPSRPASSSRRGLEDGVYQRHLLMGSIPRERAAVSLNMARSESGSLLPVTLNPAREFLWFPSTRPLPGSSHSHPTLTAALHQ